MFREYKRFLADYFKIAYISKKYLFLSITLAILYRGFAVLIPLSASWIVRYISEGRADMAYVSLGAMAIFYLLYSLSLYANYKIYGRNMGHIYNSLQTAILNRLVRIDDKFVNVLSKGRLANSVNSDVVNIGDMNDEVAELASIILQFITIVVIVALFNGYLAIILALYCIIYTLARNRADRSHTVYRQKAIIQDDKYSDFLGQIVSGLPEIRAFNLIPKLKKILDSIQKKYSSFYMKSRRIVTMRDNDIEFITFAFRIALYILLIFMMIWGQIDIATLILVIAYHETLAGQLDDLIICTAYIRETSISIGRVREILNYKSGQVISYGTNSDDDIVGAITFKNVNFSYQSGRPVIRNFNLKIKHDSFVAIVGESGSGKTALINLLLRLYKVDSGKILVDDIDIYDFTRSVYATNVAVVNQKPFIFNMSIRENLNFVDTNVKNQITACKKVGIHDFIMSLPKGYNTVLRENANNVSGGQKQLISIARTLLSKSEILLFDDITTALDPDTMKKIPKLLQDLKENHTIVVTTKKPEIMESADRIIVLSQGKIVGDGTHKKLIRTNEDYQMLYAHKSASRIGEPRDV